MDSLRDAVNLTTLGLLKKLPFNWGDALKSQNERIKEEEERLERILEEARVAGPKLS